MRTLLINPKRAQGEPLAFPLGLAYIVAVLKKERHLVDVLDLNSTENSDAALISKLSGSAYDLFAITAMIINFKAVQNIAAILKEHYLNVPVLLGGGLASAIPEMVLDDTQIDICILGEGEITIKELLGALSRKEDLRNIKGICFKRDNEVVFTQSRQEYVDVNTLPFPAWDLFPMEIYLKSKASLNSNMDIITSRGCPYKCTFCFTGIFGHKFRGRSAESMVEEIRTLKERYQIGSFVLRDDMFVMDKKRVVEFCERLISERLKFSWSCNGRINLMDKDMLKLMRKAGCTNISYGIESGNLDILSNMKKQIDLQKAKEIIRMTRRVGIIPLGYFILGMPDETRETIQESIDFCKETGIIPHFNFAGPIPGTELYSYALERGYIRDAKEYLLQANWKSISVNMSELSDEELLQIGEGIEARIMKYHLWRYPGLIGLISWRFLQDEGVGLFAKKIMKWLVSSSWSPFCRKKQKVQGKEVAIVHFLDLEWEADHRRPHIEAISKHCKVICVEPPVTLLTPFIKPKVFFKWLLKKRNGISQENNIYLYRPFMPLPYVVAYRFGVFEFLNRIFLRLSLWGARKLIAKNKIVNFITCPQQTCVLNTLNEDIVCFDCYDAYGKHPQSSQKIRKFLYEAEKKISRKADIVFVTAETLYREKMRVNPNTYYVPNSADVRLFMEATKLKIDIPEDLENISRPRIGLIGHINEIVDIDLLNYLANIHPEWSLVLIGAINARRVFKKSKSLERLKQYPNVHFLGNKKYEELPVYQKGLDVCLLPYLINDYTDCVHPNKIYQYLAQKKPVVSTNLKEVNNLRDVIYVTDTKEGFEQYIDEILNNGSTKNVNGRLLQVAMANSTDSAAKKRIKIINDYMEKNGI